MSRFKKYLLILTLFFIKTFFSNSSKIHSDYPWFKISHHNSDVLNNNFTIKQYEENNQTLPDDGDYNKETIYQIPYIDLIESKIISKDDAIKAKETLLSHFYLLCRFDKKSYDKKDGTIDKKGLINQSARILNIFRQILTVDLKITSFEMSEKGVNLLDLSEEKLKKLIEINFKKTLSDLLNNDLKNLIDKNLKNTLNELINNDLKIILNELILDITNSSKKIIDHTISEAEKRTTKIIDHTISEAEKRTTKKIDEFIIKFKKLLSDPEFINPINRIILNAKKNGTDLVKEIIESPEIKKKLQDSGNEILIDILKNPEFEKILSSKLENLLNQTEDRFEKMFLKILQNPDIKKITDTTNGITDDISKKLNNFLLKLSIVGISGFITLKCVNTLYNCLEKNDYNLEALDRKNKRKKACISIIIGTIFTAIIVKTLSE